MRRTRRSPSIQIRLTLWYTSVLLVILLVISGLAYSLLARALEQDVDAAGPGRAAVVVGGARGRAAGQADDRRRSGWRAGMPAS